MLKGSDPLLKHLKTVDSTNNYALNLAREGAEHGTVVWADEQTDGRGQFDRKWFSDPGKDLSASVIVRPEIKASDASQITLRAAEIIREELLNIYGLKASDLQIKAPNDLILRGKKVCGILTESSIKGQKVEYVIIGYGINLNGNSSKNIPNSISFYEELSRNIEIYEVLFRTSQNLIKNIL